MSDVKYLLPKKELWIPLISILAFLILSYRFLFPHQFGIFHKADQSYKFSQDTLGYFIGETSFFEDLTIFESEEKILKLFPESLQAKIAPNLRPILTLCEKHQLDPFWVLSVIWTESHFNTKALSHKGARGLMQVMPKTQEYVLNKMKRKNIVIESNKGEEYLKARYTHLYHSIGYHRLVARLNNLESGIFYLNNLFKSFKNYHHATVAYNMGPYWTKVRLARNLPVGKKNQYLDKVRSRYLKITSSNLFSHLGRRNESNL